MIHRIPYLLLAGLLAAPAWADEFVCPGPMDLYVSDSGWEHAPFSSFVAMTLGGNPGDLQTATCLAPSASSPTGFVTVFREVEPPCQFEGAGQTQVDGDITTCLFAEGSPEDCRLVCE